MEKKYTEAEYQSALEKEKEKMKETAKVWAEEKAQEVAKVRAIRIAEEYKKLSAEEQRFEQDKKQLQFYIEEWALPDDMTLWKMMMNRQLGRELWLSLIQTINGIAFVNGKPSVYGETYLSLIVKNGYRIHVISESDEKVEIELEWPNWKQKWSYTKAEAETAGIYRNVWLKYPKRMLRYKAIRNAQNVLCPDILGWAYLYEEEQEVANVTVVWWEWEQQKAKKALEKMKNKNKN